jgi:hypothetical protein
MKKSNHTQIIEKLMFFILFFIIPNTYTFILNLILIVVDFHNKKNQ